MADHIAPTVDDVADLLPPLVRAVREIADMLELLTDISCLATNLPAETADTMADIGESITRQARSIMREVRRRRAVAAEPLAGSITAAPTPASPA
jgi:hypothetical protein